MSTFYAFYPSASASANPSVGTNGATAPTSSTEVAGINPSGNLQPLQTDASGNLLVTPATGSVGHVIVDSSALPTGAATSALQTTGNSSLSSITTNTANLSRMAGALVPTAFDEVDLTYVPSGNGVGQVATAVYKLATVTVKTLTFTYDSNSKLSSVVAS